MSSLEKSLQCLKSVESPKLTYTSHGFTRCENSWVFISVDKSIADYYCSAAKSFGINLKPTDNPHITVVAGKYEQIENYDFKKQKVEFKYGNLLTGGLYYWLEVDCEWIHEFRESNGLKRELKYKPHISVGKLNDNWGRKIVKRVKER